MSNPIDLTVPYGASGRGFHRKNIFADQRRLLGPDTRTVVDVGAHHGEEIATFLQMFPEAIVHAIEPTPESLEALRKAYGDTPRVKIHAGSLAEVTGVSLLHMYAASECNSLTAYAPEPSLNRTSLGTAERVPVQTWTLDQFCAEQRLDQIDLLKVDTQGAELRVLAGGVNVLTSRRIRLLALEVSFVPLYEQQAEADEILARLRQLQYRPYDWYNFTYDDNGQVLFGDAMFLPAYPPAAPEPLGLYEAGSEERDGLMLTALTREESQIRELVAENGRLRADIEHFRERIARYRSKTEHLRRRLKLPDSE